MNPPKKLEEVKVFIEENLKCTDTAADFDFEIDPETNGYCYIVKTKFALGIFSDNNPEKELKMFIVKNSAMNYAVEEGLTHEQFLDYKSCVEIPCIMDFMYILEHPIQHRLKI